ncbi:hypothetical protein EV141_0037 [Microcella putealis]|uniref:Uncharacterized protein n=1 Tax=Microcella putealis TaxID=337005 RepID=A0A4V2EXA7_9MICO|nr:hypothetical protein [Microcella putealis]RZS58830.1 hypothetical protein EV141_0037 [Microcella putealis]TQM23856.1 hypothetical protein BJ957_1316 [Microcella putealis]
MPPIRPPRDVLHRAAFVGAGAVLVGAFTAWLALRQSDAIRSAVGMDTALGWALQIIAYLVLMTGVASIARGVFSRSTDEPSN